MDQVRRWGPALAVAVAALLAAGSAQAHWRGSGGVFVGVAPPVYVPPPFHAAPYPYHSPYYAVPAATEGCYAGAWVCPLDRPAAVGQPCACPTGQGPGGQGQAWGRAR